MTLIRPHPINRQEIADEIVRLAPFHHSVDLPFGLSTHIPERARRPVESTRVSNLVRHAFPALMDACGGSLQDKRVLDVACNCGGFSVEAARRGSPSVLGIDVVDHYIEQAALIKRALGLEQLDFRVLDLEALDGEVTAPFDVTFCFGILYHLENPVQAMRILAQQTRHCMLIDTDLFPPRPPSRGLADRNG